MPIVELERRLVKSQPELGADVSVHRSLSRWLGEVRLRNLEPPHRLEWESSGAGGVIELEALGWGTRVRVRADIEKAPAWERLQARYGLERSLRGLLDDLGRSSLNRRARAQ